MRADQSGKRKLICLFMEAALFLSLPLCFASFAEEENASAETGHLPFCAYSPAQAGTPCLHTHDDACGYRPALAATPCQYVHICSESCHCTCVGAPCEDQHIHDAACGYDPLTGLGCADVHTHDEQCGYIEADPSAHVGCCDVHVHDAFCGESPGVQASPCLHEHDESCGYTPPQAEVSCTCAQVAAEGRECTRMPDDGIAAPQPDATTDSHGATELIKPAVTSDGTNAAGEPGDANPADELDGATAPNEADIAAVPGDAAAFGTPGETEPALKPAVTLPETRASATVPAAPPLDENATDIAVNDAGTAFDASGALDAAKQQNTSSFYVMIPGSLTLRSDLSEINIAVDGVQDGETILLTFYSENNFQLTDGAVAVPYSLSADGAAICGATAYPCIVTGGCIRLQVKVGQFLFSGSYSDTLRFAISLPSQAETEQTEQKPAENVQPEAGPTEAEQAGTEPQETAPLYAQQSTTGLPAPDNDPLEIKPPEEILP